MLDKDKDGNEINKRRERRMVRMVLRCTINKKGELFIGQCLELGVVSQGSTERECKRNIKNAIESYIQAAQAAEGDVVIRRVPFYFLRKLVFDFNLSMRHKDKHNDKYFRTERSVPVGI